MKTKRQVKAMIDQLETDLENGTIKKRERPFMIAILAMLYVAYVLVWE